MSKKSTPTDETETIPMPEQDVPDESEYTKMEQAHYEQIRAKNRDVQRLCLEMERTKADAAHAKKEYDAAVNELRSLIANGADPQAELPFPDELPDVGSWESTPLDVIFVPQTASKCFDAGIETAGKLHEWCRTYKLTDIKGIGTGNAGAMEAKWEEFRGDNPALGMPELMEVVEA